MTAIHGSMQIKKSKGVQQVAGLHMKPYPTNKSVEGCKLTGRVEKLLERDKESDQHQLLAQLVLLLNLSYNVCGTCMCQIRGE